MCGGKKQPKTAARVWLLILSIHFGIFIILDLFRCDTYRSSGNRKLWNFQIILWFYLDVFQSTLFAANSDGSLLIHDAHKCLIEIQLIQNFKVSGEWKTSMAILHIINENIHYQMWFSVILSQNSISKPFWDFFSPPNELRLHRIILIWN